MSAVLEKARGATTYGARDRLTANSANVGAVVFVNMELPHDGDWAAMIAKLRTFRSLEDDWDGEGSVAPPPELVDCALGTAQNLRWQGVVAPDRVVAGVNGTICFEWHSPLEYHQIEFVSPTEIEGRSMPRGGGEAVTAMRYL